MKTTVEYNLDVKPIKSITDTDEGYLKLWLGISDSNNPLVYLSENGVIVENIDTDELFNIDSLNTLVGKPISNGHPDIQYLNADNISDYQVGSILQETRNNDGVLEVAAIITNPETVQKIKNKELVYTSAAYHADKINVDDNGTTKTQRNRKYNHIALLNTNEIPRAGIKSRIIFNSYNTDNADTIQESKSVNISSMNDDDKKFIAESIANAFAKFNNDIETNVKNIILDMQNNADTETNTNDTTDTETNLDSYTPLEMAERVKIITKYQDVIKVKTKSETVDYNLDSQDLKRIVLSTIVPEKTLTNLDSSDKISGAFEIYQIFKDKFNNNSYDDNDDDDDDDINLDSTSARQNFINKICNKG